MRKLFLFFLLLSSSLIYSQKLVGISDGGGANQYGSIFQYDLSNSSFTVLHSFDSSCTSWINPPSIIEAKNGNLYSVEENCRGSIFEFDPKSSTYSRVLSFDTTNLGSSPTSLTPYSDHEFIGVCRQGGLYGHGTLFKFDYVNQTVEKLHDFDSTISPAPSKGLVHYKDDLYLGNSTYGGMQFHGTLFQFNVRTKQLDVLMKYYDVIAQSLPFVASNNIIFSPTYIDYDYSIPQYVQAPVIFAFDPVGDSIFTTQVFEPALYGYKPHTQFIEFDSILYSVSSFGIGLRSIVSCDLNGVGQLYTIMPDSFGPADELMLASDSLLYGVSQYRGDHGRGVLFSFDPRSKSWRKLHDLTFQEGDLSKGRLFELSECAGIDRTINFSGSGLLGAAESGASYQWVDLNHDSLITNATGQYFEPRDTGLFAAIIQKGNCLDTSNAIRVLSVGINKMNLDASIDIFPNPSNGWVNVQHAFLENFTISIYTLEGQLVKKIQMHPSDDHFRLPQESGIYLLSIEVQDGRRIHRKLIKE